MKQDLRRLPDAVERGSANIKTRSRWSLAVTILVAMPTAPSTKAAAQVRFELGTAGAPATTVNHNVPFTAGGEAPMRGMNLGASTGRDQLLWSFEETEHSVAYHTASVFDPGYRSSVVDQQRAEGPTEASVRPEQRGGVGLSTTR